MTKNRYQIKLTGANTTGSYDIIFNVSQAIFLQQKQHHYLNVLEWFKKKKKVYLLCSAGITAAQLSVQQLNPQLILYTPQDASPSK